MRIRTSLSLVGLLLVALSPARAQHGDFETSWIGYESSDFEAARYAVAAELVDLDNDGDLDVAIANWWAPSQVTVILNRGNGRYDAPAYYPLLPMMGSLDIAAADFDEDGFIDLVAPNSGPNWDGYKVSLLLNEGDGTFAPHKTFIAGSGPHPGVVGLAPADFDGDGHVDLACANYGYLGQGNTITLLRGDGQGGFLPGVPYGCGSAPYMIAAGDLDADGRPDLVAARDDQKISVLLNTGGGFAPFVEYPALTFINTDVYPAVELADTDLDGDLDVLYSSSNMHSFSGDGAVALFLNQGSGALAPAQAVELSEFGGAVDLAVADVTGDGWPDILGVHGVNDRWSLVPSLGGGSFGQALHRPSGNYPFAIEAGDTDGDGRADAVIANRISLAVNVHRPLIEGTFELPFSYAASPAYGFIVQWQAAGDIDADGDLDIACAYGHLFQAGGGITVLRNNGNGSYGFPDDYPSDQRARSVKLSDLDGDGLPDLVWADNRPPYNFRVRMNQGGFFGPETIWPAYTCGTYDLITEDLEGDGDLDVLMSDSCGYVTVCRNTGAGTFLAPYYVQMCTAAHHILLVDMNADGHKDLVSSEVCIRLGNGNGTFGAAIQYMTDGGPRDVAAADFDGNGTLDLATSNYAHAGSSGQQSISILFGYGDGAVKPPVTYPATLFNAGLGVNLMEVGDVDEDGDPDLVVSNGGSNDVSLFRNRGDGTFEPHLRYGAGWGASGVLLRDLDGDGSLDMSVIVDTDTLGFGQAVAMLPGNPPDVIDPVSYCVGKTNSAGTVADVGWSGTPDWFSADFQLVVTGGLPGALGLVFYSTSGLQSTPIYGGTLCVAPPIKRLPAHLLDPLGATTYDIPIQIGMIGTTRWYQMWYRDPQHPDGTGVGLSDGLEVTFFN